MASRLPSKLTRDSAYNIDPVSHPILLLLKDNMNINTLKVILEQ
jgi:hypothetical protein